MYDVSSDEEEEEEEEAAGCSSAVNRNPVAADGRKLLVAFSEKQSVLYSEFKQCWIDFKFTFVYW